MAISAIVAKQSLAFNSYFPWVHDDIIDQGLAGMGFSNKAIKKIKYAARQQDWDETSVAHWYTPWDLRPNANYRPEHHFDRNPADGGNNPAANKKAFKRGALYVQQENIDVINNLKAGNTRAALDAIGRALHAIADLKSHSNFVNLNAADQAMVETALYSPNPTLPTSFTLTAYDPNPKHSDPGHPIDPTTGKRDTYAHDDHAKDSANKNTDAQAVQPGKAMSNFELAKAAAIKETTDFINRKKTELQSAGLLSLWNKFTTFASATDYSESGYAMVTHHRFTTAGGNYNDSISSISLPSNAVTIDTTVTSLDVPLNFFSGSQSLKTPDGSYIIQVNEFRPDGLMFNMPVTITLTYADDNASNLDESSLRAYYYDPTMESWTKIAGSVVDTANNTITFQTTHFSVYGIGGNMPSTGTDTYVYVIAGFIILFTGMALLVIRKGKQQPV